MLCPEIWNFPPPKIMCNKNEKETIEEITKRIKMNYFYDGIIITCPDEIQMPSIIKEIVTEDTDYYKITECPLTEFLNPLFIESFVKNGNLFCLSTDRNCITQNCFCIADGMLTLHIFDFVYQILGFEGKKRPHNYYEVIIDLKNLKKPEKVYKALNKLELFDFHVIWEPPNENVCPSSIAKYFSDNKFNVTSKALTIKNISPSIIEVPCLKDVDIEEMVEWTGVLAHKCNLNQQETYISTYQQPESENALKTNRISILRAKGLITPSVIVNLCSKISEYVVSRELDNYWVSLSIQSCDHSLWQWTYGSPKMFQSLDSSYNIFFTLEGQSVYSIGQIKYS